MLQILSVLALKMLLGVPSASATQMTCNVLFDLDPSRQRFYLDILQHQSYLGSLLSKKKDPLPLIAAFDLRPSKDDQVILRIVDAGARDPQELQAKIRLFQTTLENLNLPYQRAYLFDAQQVQPLIGAQNVIGTLTPQLGLPSWRLRKMAPTDFLKGWTRQDIDDIGVQLVTLHEKLLEHGLGGFPLDLILSDDGVMRITNVENIILQRPELSHAPPFNLIETQNRVRTEWLEHGGS